MRHDSTVIKNIAKRYGLSIAKEIQQLPFFYMTAESEKQFCDLHSPKNEDGNYRVKAEYVLNLDDPLVKDILPFENFCIMIEDLGWFHLQYIDTGKWFAVVCADQGISSMFGDETLGVLIGHSLKYNSIRRTKEEVIYEGLVNAEVYDTEGFKVNSKIKEAFNLATVREEYAERILGSFGQNIEYVIAYFKWAEGLHMTKVQKKPNKQDQKSEKHGDKKPWTRSDRPHYIYLDAPQTEADHPANQTGERRSVRGHPRRAHWYTLRDSRFKNHPKYGIPQRKRATWVGPHEWTVKDTIYTVHIP